MRRRTYWICYKVKSCGIRSKIWNNAKSENENWKTKLKVKLPKPDLKPFVGSVLNWQRFRDHFDSCMHRITDLNDMDKFSYFQSLFFCSFASESISGLTMTVEKYTEARTFLQVSNSNTRVQTSNDV